ncbi:MAG: hypothetical protein E6H93_00005 [Chloroflexi bacterium]|nr:MAG: hypothetical protein E6H93_00005 [Chloroflexota bacterium]
MATAVTDNPMLDLLAAAETTLRDVAIRRRGHRATRADRAAERLAMEALMTVADDLQACLGGDPSGADASFLEGVRRDFRRYELLHWRTAPEFLRTR